MDISTITLYYISNDNSFIIKMDDRKHGGGDLNVERKRFQQ